MKRAALLAALLLVAGSIRGLAQGPNDPNEGCQFLYNASTDSFNLQWWGRAGKSYFVQINPDLLSSWIYLPIIMSGADDVLALGFEREGSEKLFYRLEMMSYDPYTTDRDGDGMPDGYEVMNFLDPRNADWTLDPDGDGMSNLYEVTNGLNAMVDDGSLDLDGDLILNREDARPNDPNIGRLTVTISAPGIVVY